MLVGSQYLTPLQELRQQARQDRRLTPHFLMIYKPYSHYPRADEENNFKTSPFYLFLYSLKFSLNI